MWNYAYYMVLYEIAVRSLPRVHLKTKPGVVGIVLDRNLGTTLVHWGVSDKNVVRSWHANEKLEVHNAG